MYSKSLSLITSVVSNWNQSNTHTLKDTRRHSPPEWLSLQFVQYLALAPSAPGNGMSDRPELPSWSDLPICPYLFPSQIGKKCMCQVTWLSFSLGCSFPNDNHGTLPQPSGRETRPTCKGLASQVTGTQPVMRAGDLHHVQHTFNSNWSSSRNCKQNNLAHKTSPSYTSNHPKKNRKNHPTSLFLGQWVVAIVDMELVNQHEMPL